LHSTPVRRKVGANLLTGKQIKQRLRRRVTPAQVRFFAFN
jgi:hypothetical protein